MSPHSVSQDLKNRIPVLRHLLGFNVKAICQLLGIQKSLVYNTLSYHRRFGTCHSPFALLRGTRHRLLSTDDMHYLRGHLIQNSTVYLDEIQDILRTKRNISVSIPTLVRSLRRMAVTHKQVAKRAIERDDMRRAHYMNHIGTVAPDPSMLMFLDESACDRRTSGRRYGWATRGLRCVQRQCFVRGTRYSLLPALTLDGIVTYDIFQGSVTTELFLEFLREMVVR